jgi:hypothetical protein
MFYNRSWEEWFFFDIDVKGGENSRREDLNACGFLCCHQCQRGRLLENLVNRQRMLVIDGNSEDDMRTTSL